MTYIWINPVIDCMYESGELNDFLCRHGYKRVHTSTDWLTVVKEKYRQAVCQATHTVVDVRCPKIKELIDEMDISEQITLPEINPILIHCGQELAESEKLRGEEKIITTPCQSLADMGNALGLEDTRFVSWNHLVEATRDELKSIQPKESPIPPGFFEKLRIHAISCTGEEEIRNCMKHKLAENVQLVEMLFCKNGCHNGDGIKPCG